MQLRRETSRGIHLRECNAEPKGRGEKEVATHFPRVLNISTSIRLRRAFQYSSESRIHRFVLYPREILSIPRHLELGETWPNLISASVTIHRPDSRKLRILPHPWLLTNYARKFQLRFLTSSRFLISTNISWFSSFDSSSSSLIIPLPRVRR